MRTAFSWWSIACVVAAASMLASAPAAGQTTVSVGTDPAAWVLDGYSVVVGVEDDSAWRYSLEVWGLEFPAPLVELWGDNDGWSRRVDVSVALAVDYQLGQDADGLHVGVVCNALRSTAAKAGLKGSFWSVELLPKIGYRWFVWKQLFIDPWMGAGPIIALQKTPGAQGDVFVEAPLQAVATAHMGWRF